jgi:hypothetical protein
VGNDFANGFDRATAKSKPISLLFTQKPRQVRRAPVQSAIAARPAMLTAGRSLRSPTCHEPDYYHDHSDHQNNVDQASGDMEGESEKPQDE